MTKRQITLAGALLISLYINSAYAVTNVTTKPADTDPWSGKLDFGYNESTGDTIDKNATLNFETTYKTDEWNNIAQATGVESDDENGRTAESYSLMGEANFFFKKNVFLFARSNNVYDAFGAYDISLSNSAGFGKRLIDNDTLTLDAQAGPGDLRQRENNSNQFTDELTFFTKESVTWTLTKNASLTHYLSIEFGHPNTHGEVNIALNTDVIGHWGLSLSYTALYDSFLPETSPDKHKLDTLTQVAVSYTF